MSKEPTDLDDDYNFSRKTYYELIETAREMIPKLAGLCDESEHPRAFEVLFKALKDTADANDKFLELQRRKQVIDRDNGDDHSGALTEQETETKAIAFDGSTDDLLARIEKLNSEKKMSEEAIDVDYEEADGPEPAVENDKEA